MFSMLNNSRVIGDGYQIMRHRCLERQKALVARSPYENLPLTVVAVGLRRVAYLGCVGLGFRQRQSCRERPLWRGR